MQNVLGGNNTLVMLKGQEEGHGGWSFLMKKGVTSCPTPSSGWTR